MLVKIGSAFIDPNEIAAIVPYREDGLTDIGQATQICITLRQGGGFWIDAPMDEAEAALIDAGVIENPYPEELPELSEGELTALEKLEAGGYRWLARDKTGHLYAYRGSTPPEYDGAYWNGDPASEPNNTRVDPAADNPGASIFGFITEQDEEPWEIEKLLRVNF